MDEDNIRTLLERIKCCHVRKSGDEISCSCPFSNNHKRGDRRPSFGVRICPGDTSPFNCFSCGASGIIEQLAIQYGHEDLAPKKTSSVKRREWLYPAPSLGAMDPSKNSNRTQRVFFKDEYLVPFHSEYHQYFLERGISEETYKVWELGYDQRFFRAIFIVRDVKQRLAVVIGRDVTGNGNRAKYSNYVLDLVEKELIPYFPPERDRAEFVGPTKSFFLYGEHIVSNQLACNPSDTRPIVIVEGPIDVLSMWQRGYLAMGVLGSYASDSQVSKIVDIVPVGGKVVVMADGDQAGGRMAIDLVNKLCNRVRTYLARLEPGYDPADSSDDMIVSAIANASPVTSINK